MIPAGNRLELLKGDPAGRQADTAFGSTTNLNAIILGKPGITVDTALRLARLLKTSPTPPDATSG